LNDVVGQVPIPNGPGLEGKPQAKRDVSAREALDYFTAQQSSEGPGKATYEELPAELQKYAEAHKAYRARQDAAPKPGLMDGFSLNKAVEEVSGSLVVGPIKAVNNMAKFVGLGGNWADYPQPQTIAGGITQGVAQFLTGMVGVNKLQALAGVPGASGILGSLGDAAAANIVSSDPNAGRLSDLINEFPSLRNPVTKFLASDPNDSEAVGQLKNGLEGTVLGAFGEAFSVALKGLKAQWHGIESGQMVPEGAILHSQETSEEVKKILDNMGPDLAKPEDFRKGGFATQEQLEIKKGNIPRAIPADETQIIKPVSEEPATTGAEAPKEPQTEPVPAQTAPEATTSSGQLEVQATTDGGSQIKATPAASDQYKEFVANLTPGQRNILQKQLYTQADQGLKDPVSDLAALKQSLMFADLSSRPVLSRPSLKTLKENIAKAAEAQNTGAGSSLPNVSTGIPVNLSKYDMGSTGGKMVVDELAKHLATNLNADQLKVMSLGMQQHLASFVADGDIKQLMPIFAQDAADQTGLMARIGAAGMVTKSLSDSVYAQMEAMRLNGGGDVFQKAKLMQTLDDLSSVASSNFQSRSGIARTLGSFRNQNELISATTAQLEAKLGEIGGDPAIAAILTKIKATQGNPGALPKIVQYTLTQKTGRAIGSGLVNIMLCSVSPVQRALLSQLVNSVMAPANKMVGGALSFNKSAIVEGMGHLVGMVTGVRNAIKLAATALRTESSPLRGDIPQANALSTEALGISDMPLAHGLDFLFHSVRIGSKLLVSHHEFIKGVNYNGVVTGRAWSEAAGLGLEGDAFTAHVAKKIAGAYDQTTGQALDISGFQEASRASLTQDLTPNGFMDHVTKAVNSSPILKAFAGAWFLKVSSNAIDQTLSSLPGMGLIPGTKGVTSAGEDFSGINGNGLKAAAIGKQAIAGAIMLSTVMGAMGGSINGFGPTDPVANKTWRQNGNKPYTTNIGGIEFEYGRVEGIGSLMGLAADATHFASEAPDKYKGIQQAIISSLAANLSSKTFLESALETAQMLTDPNADVQGWFRNRASSLVPTIFKQASSALGMDPDFAPKISSTLDAIKAKLPYVRGGLPTAYDALGKPMPYSYNDGNYLWDSFAGSTGLDRPVFNELQRLQKGISRPPMKWGNVELSPEQYAKWNKLIGEVKVPYAGESVNLETYLTKTIQSEKYQRLGLGDGEYRSLRLGEIVSIIEGFRGKAQGQMMKPDSPDYEPSLDRAVRNDRQNMKTMSTAQDPSKVNKLPTDPLQILKTLNK